MSRAAARSTIATEQPCDAVTASDSSAGLRFEDAVCCLCGATTASPEYLVPDWTRGKAPSFRYVRCTHCGLVYQQPRPDRASIAAAYPATYGPFQPAARARSILHRVDVWYGLTKRRRFVERWIASGTLLDVGCGNGDLLACFARTGRWQVVGTEIVPSAARSGAATHRLSIVLAAADAPAPFQAGSFDVICLWDVLEHLHDPRAALTEARRLIKSTGMLFIATPDIASPQARLFGPCWQGYDAPRHLWLFSRTTLLRLLGETGWSAVDVSAFTGATRTLLLSMGWWLEDRLGPRWGSITARLVQSSIGRIGLAIPLWMLMRFGLTSHVCVAARPADREPGR